MAQQVLPEQVRQVHTRNLDLGGPISNQRWRDLLNIPKPRFSLARRELFIEQTTKQLRPDNPCKKDSVLQWVLASLDNSQ